MIFSKSEFKPKVQFFKGSYKKNNVYVVLIFFKSEIQQILNIFMLNTTSSL